MFAGIEKLRAHFPALRTPAGSAVVLFAGLAAFGATTGFFLLVDRYFVEWMPDGEIVVLALGFLDPLTVLLAEGSLPCPVWRVGLRSRLRSLRSSGPRHRWRLTGASGIHARAPDTGNLVEAHSCWFWLAMPAGRRADLVARRQRLGRGLPYDAVRLSSRRSARCELRPIWRCTPPRSTRQPST